MPIPRFIEQGVPYEIYLFCPKCAWAITKDSITENWTICRNRDCGSRLVTRRIDYPSLKDSER